MTASDAGEPRTAAGKALLAELRRDVHWFIGGSSAKELAFVTAIEDEAAREPLDAAWREAEAALPQSDPPWMLTLHTYVREPDGEPFVEACAYAPMYEDAVQVFGSTPAAALRALAEALRKPVPA